MYRGLAVALMTGLVLAALLCPHLRIAADESPKPGTIITIAGSGAQGGSGDGGPATRASLNTPVGLAADRMGNLFFADAFNSRVRKVSLDGTISTIAGTGRMTGPLGDDGPAAAARLNFVFGLAIDAEDNLYIGDYGNSRIRKVSPSGTITTAAGNGKFSYSGDGGPATQASFNGPATIAADASGNLYFTDFYNRAVRRVSPNGIINTVAGRGKPADGLGDGGPATQALLKSPAGVAVDAAGNVFISDFTTHRVRRVSPTGIITTIAGGGSPTDGLGDGALATKASLKLPRGLAVDAGGNLFIADNGHFRVRKVGPDGVITTVAGTGQPGFSGDGGPATEARLDSPINLAIDRAGNLFIGDSWEQTPDDFVKIGNNRIRKVFGVAVPE
jgi:sugar lactone lactonase YvrE